MLKDLAVAGMGILLLMRKQTEGMKIAVIFHNGGNFQNVVIYPNALLIV